MNHHNLLLALVSLLAACGEPPPGPTVWNAPGTTPELLAPGVISTDLYERDFALSPDGSLLIFSRGDARQTRRVLLGMKHTDSGWGEPEVLPFSGRQQDIEPFFSPDGNWLFFASDRPMDADSSRTDYNIWRVDHRDGNWGEPQALDTLINKAGDEFYPAVSANGDLYFTATREGGPGREDLYVSNWKDGGYGPAQALDTTVNTPLFEFNAYVNPAGDLLVFSSFGRSDGLGGGDLYYSRKDSAGNWQASRNLGAPINTERLEYCPYVDLKAGILYFTSERRTEADSAIRSADALKQYAGRIENGLGNIYHLRWQPE